MKKLLTSLLSPFNFLPFTFKLCSCFLVLTFNPSALTIAQNPNIKRTYNWHFGEYGAITFTNDSVFVVNTSQLISDEGCASMSDTSGNLLFYTNGEAVWNVNNDTMPNGSGLLGSTTSTQSALIVPFPNHPNLYFIFTVCPQAGYVNGCSSLSYSILDMSLDSGLGDIVDSTKNTFLYSPVTEKLTATQHANKQDYWVIAHEWNTNNFITYLIDSTGINTNPIISATGNIHSGGANNVNTIGSLKVSNDGTLLACSIQYEDSMFIFNFSNTNGSIMSLVSFPSFYPYDAAFSNDNSKIYISDSWNGIIYQYDISVIDVNAILNSKFQVSSSSNNSLGLQNASNGYIYISNFYQQNISCIKFPNLQGLNCEYIDTSLFLNYWFNCRFMFPNIINSYLKDKEETIGTILKYNLGITIFPNPANDVINIDYNNNNVENVNIDLFDIYGELKGSYNKAMNNIDISSLQNGLYLLKFQTKDKVIIKKFIKD